MKDYTLPLVKNFQRFFKIERATTDAQEEAAYRIRYRVSCEELGLNTEAAVPDTPWSTCGLYKTERDRLGAHFNRTGENIA